MKKNMEVQEQLSLFLNDKRFKIDLKKLSQILKKLNLDYAFNGSYEFEKFLKKYHLFEEEFLEFVSMRSE